MARFALACVFAAAPLGVVSQGGDRFLSRRLLDDTYGETNPVNESSSGVVVSRRTHTATAPRSIRWGSDQSFCLSIKDNSFKNGQDVWLWHCDGDGSIGQKFILDDQGLLRVAADQKYCVVIDGNQDRNGANIQLWACDGAPVQQWYHSGNSEFRNAVNGKCVVVNNNQGYNGNNIQLWSCDGDAGYKWWAMSAAGVCASEGQSCGWNNDQMEDCCDGMQCKPFVGGSNMQCVRARPTCAPGGHSCGWNNAQTQDCCDDMQCKPVLGGSNMHCVRAPPYCALEGHSCGWNNDQTQDCCDNMECTPFVGGSNMQCLKKRNMCVAQGEYCGGPGQRTLECCTGNCQYPPNSNTKVCKDV